MIGYSVDSAGFADDCVDDGDDCGDDCAWGHCIEDDADCLVGN